MHQFNIAQGDKSLNIISKDEDWQQLENFTKIMAHLNFQIGDWKHFQNQIQRLLNFFIDFDTCLFLQTLTFNEF